jgi:glucose-fructose oxidoreductase
MENENFLKPAQNRRQFMQSLSMGLGSAVLASSLPLYSACAASSQNKKMGIALVGLGYYSTDILAPALQETQHCYLAGVVTGTPAKAEAWMKKYNIPSKNVYNYQNFDQIVKNPAIDIVYVVLPNHMHKEYTIRAANAGKHVICEKPMALNAQECEEMIKACEKNKVSLAIGYRMQHERTTQEIIRYRKEKVFGGIKMVTAGAGYRESREGHWKMLKETGGGAMMDMGVYVLQAARYATGEEPVSVTAQQYVHRTDLFKGVDETTTFQLHFPSGAVANLHTSFGVNMNYLYVSAESGWYNLDPFSSYSGIKGMSKNGPISFPHVNQQARQMDDAALAIMQKKPQLVPGEEGLRDMIIVDAIYKAAATQSKILLG